MIDKLNFLFWWFGAVETPVLIPNTEVKRSCGDDTHMKGKVASRRYKVFNLLTLS